MWKQSDISTMWNIFQINGPCLFRVDMKKRGGDGAQYSRLREIYRYK